MCWRGGTGTPIASMVALIARAAELHPSDVPRLVSRLTVDIMQAAPMAPVSTQVEVVRAGKKVDFLDISLLAENKVLVRASAMRIRIDDVTADDYTRGQQPFPKLPDVPDFSFLNFPGAEVPGFHHAIDLRFDEHDGLPVIWFRLAVPIIDGEVTTAFQLLATGCDWTYAIPIIARRMENNIQHEDETISAINPDTNINCFRPPKGEWLGMKAQTSFGDLGSGCACAQIFDQDGPVGYCTQSVLIQGLGGIE